MGIMIEVKIHGTNEGPEAEAAHAIGSGLAATLKGEAVLHVIPDAKCWGQRTQDIDIILMLTASKGIKIPKAALPGYLKEKSVDLFSLALTIEVKDHDPQRVQFVGTKVYVKYKEGWSDASQQCHSQSIAARNFLKANGVKGPFWYGLILLRNVPQSQIPAALSNVIGGDASGSDLLRVAFSLAKEWLSKQRGPKVVMSDSGLRDSKEVDRAIAVFTHRMEPTHLDRVKIERLSTDIIQKAQKRQKYVEKLGEQLLMFRGQGGAGKTAHLLRLAANMYREFGHRILFLTYNHALVSDIRRLFALMQIADRLGERAISVQTSESYFVHLLEAFGYTVHSPDFYDAVGYQTRKDELVELLSAVPPEEAAKETAFRDNEELSRWDYVMIDEGQDWPDNERDLLYTLFSANRLIVADGVDQLIRENQCDWRSGPCFRGAPSQIIPLRKSLRQKSNLCRFITRLARKLGAAWSLEANDDVAGGKVRIVVKDYGQEAHTRIMDSLREDGNKPVDALFCAEGDQQSNRSLVRRMQNWGLDVWDGTGRTRNTMPTRIEQHRVVKYESCRGLEGWTVILTDFDKFIMRKSAQAPAANSNLLADREFIEAAEATKWSVIPLTRAIDTLVIQVDPESNVGRKVLALANEFEDFVEIL